MKIRQLLYNINLINITLISIVIYFLFYYLYPTLKLEIKMPPPEPSDIIEIDEYILEEYIPSIGKEYMIISEENLFHPERKIPVEKKVEPPPPKPDFVLYGVLVSDSISIAYLEDLKAPRNTPGRGKRIIPLRKGQTLSGFRLDEIEEDKIVMSRGEEQLIIPVIDPSHPKKRETVTITQPQPPAPQPQQPTRPRREPPTRR